METSARDVLFIRLFLLLIIGNEASVLLVCQIFMLMVALKGSKESSVQETMTAGY